MSDTVVPFLVSPGDARPAESTTFDAAPPTPTAAAARARAASRVAARVVIAVGLGLQATLRIVFALHHRTDSDEPQHLHVVWGWAHGLVQYRDLFDNHAPLFHLVMTPWLWLVGERPDVVVLGRLAMLPFVLASLIAVERLGTRLWSPRAGRWAVVCAGLSPSFLMTSTEFRADDLWMALWLWSLVVLMDGRPSVRRMATFGLLLGATLATSIKTVLLLVALGLAAVIVVTAGRDAGASRRTLGRWLASAAMGFLVVPGALAGTFAWLGAFQPMVYGTLTHNFVPGLGLWAGPSVRPWILPLAIVPMVIGGQALVRARPNGVRRRQMLVLLTAAAYIALLESYWPLITREDYLPWTPLAVLAGVAAMRWAIRQARGVQARPWRAWTPAVVGALVIGIEVAALLAAEPPWQDHTVEQRQLLQTVIAVTRPREPILDLKGETVFRPRPYFYVMEGITKTRLARKLLPDRLATDVVQTRTHWALADHPGFPPASRRFLLDHFVPFEALRVVGADLGTARAGEPRTQSFDVAFGDRFDVRADGGDARGTLDGRPVSGPVWLKAGRHEYRRAAGEGHVVVLWATAVERARAAASAAPDSRGFSAARAGR